MVFAIRSIRLEGLNTFDCIREDLEFSCRDGGRDEWMDVEFGSFDFSLLVATVDWAIGCMEG